MNYGARELAYADPFAKALASDEEFKNWVLRRTKFADVAAQARLLDGEMLVARGRAATWWRSYYTEKCRCSGCSGQETDLLAIFERTDGGRFALHVEVKQPKDRFPQGKDQASNYGVRARCWVEKAPKSVLAHDDSETMLLCCQSRLVDYGEHPQKFGAVITFDEVKAAFPNAAPAEAVDPSKDIP